MPGVTSVDSIVDAAVAVLRQYLAANLTIIDTRNNLVAGAGSANHFTSPVPASADIQSYVDTRKGSQVRVVVTDEGVFSELSTRSSANYGYASPDGTTEPSASEPRIDRRVRFGVSYLVTARGGSETTAGATSAHHARRACNRLADAGMVTLYRYPFLNVPATSTVGIARGGIDMQSDARSSEMGEGGILTYRRDQVWEATLYESRA